MSAQDSVTAVHPHVCGDNFLFESLFNSTARFTPTCVGTTLDNLTAFDLAAWFTPKCVGTTWID